MRKGGTLRETKPQNVCVQDTRLGWACHCPLVPGLCNPLSFSQAKEWAVSSAERLDKQGPEKLSHLPVTTQWSPEEKKLGPGSLTCTSSRGQAGLGFTDTPAELPSLCHGVYVAECTFLAERPVSYLKGQVPAVPSSRVLYGLLGASALKQTRELGTCLPLLVQ